MEEARAAKCARSIFETFFLINECTGVTVGLNVPRLPSLVSSSRTRTEPRAGIEESEECSKICARLLSD